MAAEIRRHNISVPAENKFGAPARIGIAAGTRGSGTTRTR